MELEQLRTFAAIARLGSLSAASRAVHLSQPAVSRQVQALEQRLGARLLERGARGVQLTEAGEAVARCAADLLHRVEEMEAELALLRGGEGGTLRVGATVTVCLYLLPPLLRRYRERYPRREILLVNERSRQIPELVRERRIDVGIASAGAPPQGVRRIPWRELGLALLEADETPSPTQDDGLARLLGAEVQVFRCSGVRAFRGPGVRVENANPSLPGDLNARTPERLNILTPEHLNTPIPFVMSTSGSLRSLTEQVLARAGIEPRVMAEADSLEVVKRLVLDGFGRALIPAANVTDEDRAAGLRDHPLPAETPRLPVVFWVRDTPHLPPAVQNFLSLAGEQLEAETCDG